MKSSLLLALSVLFLISCQKEDLRAPDFTISYATSALESDSDRMIGTITNVSSTPANTVSIRIDRYTDFNLRQDPVFIVVDKKMYHNDTAQFSFESGEQIKRVEITVADVR